MSKKKDELVTQIGHNVAELEGIVREVAGEVTELLAQRSEIQAKITEAKAKIRAKGIKLTDFNTALRLYRLEAEDRQDSIDNLRLCFAALKVAQGDLFAESEAA